MPYLRGRETRHIDVEISKEDIWKEIERVVHKKFPGEYVNNENIWEVDHGGHGSGYQERIRQATPEELYLLKALKLVKESYLNEK